MRLLFAGKKHRGANCLKELAAAGHDIAAVIAHPPAQTGGTPDSVTLTAKELGLPVVEPVDVNEPDVVGSLRELAPKLTVLAGYGQIVKRELIELAPEGCLNLHAGKLPQYRGSSPMNWVLINGEAEFTLSIIRVDEGVDTGDVLWEQTFPIAINDTIADLHNIANRVYPPALADLIARIESGTVTPRTQSNEAAGYYPLRFPDDGLVLFDTLNAEQIHNRIRALTDPYPGAFTYYNDQRIKLLESRLPKNTYYGEPGRVYLKNRNGLLVCAADRCLWIRRSVMKDSSADGMDAINRYEKLATMRGLALRAVTAKEK